MTRDVYQFVIYKKEKKEAMTKQKMVQVGPSHKRQKKNVQIDLLEIITTAENEVEFEDTRKETVESVDDVLKMYKEGKNGFTIKLQVCHIEVPKYKNTEKKLVHLYLINESISKLQQVLQSFSDRLAMLINEKTMPNSLAKTLVRVTLWGASLEECKAKFCLGNIIIVKRFTNLNTFRDLLQCNCTLEQVEFENMVI